MTLNTTTSTFYGGKTVHIIRATHRVIIASLKVMFFLNSGVCAGVKRAPRADKFCTTCASTHRAQ